MKIAYVPSLYDENVKDATNITLTHLSREIKKRNECVTIFSQRENNKIHATVNGVEIYRYYDLPKNPPNFFNPFSLAKSFFKEIFDQPLAMKKALKQKHTEFDIVHGFSSSPMISVRTLFCKLFAKKAKLVHTIKGNTRYRFSNVFTFILNFFDAVIVPSKILRKKLISRGCIPRKIKIIRSPIDVEKFKPQNKSSLKKKYGYSGNIVLYYGHLSEVKGISDLIEAASLIDDETIKFLFVTPSIKRHYEKYVSKIKERNLQHKISVITKKVKIEDYVNLADVVVLPYPDLISTEGNPSCLLESMAAKTPVVTTELDELKEIVVPGRDVLMAKPKNPKSIAKNIMAVLSDSFLAKRLAENAHKIVKNFDLKLIAKQHNDLYEEILK